MPAPLTITDSTISDNEATDEGGGVYTDDGSLDDQRLDDLRQ